MAITPPSKHRALALICPEVKLAQCEAECLSLSDASFKNTLRLCDVFECVSYQWEGGLVAFYVRCWLRVNRFVRACSLVGSNTTW